MSKKIIDLEMGKDGSYSPKDTAGSKKKKQEIQKFIPREKPTIFKENHADEFLSGIDVGLDFIDKVVPRVERFLRLRG